MCLYQPTMKSTCFLRQLFAIADDTDFGEWIAFRHPNPDVLFSFRFDDNNHGCSFPPVVVTYSPDRIAVFKYYGSFHPSMFTAHSSWDALRSVREHLGM